MMKKILILLFIFLIVSQEVFAVSPQKKIFGNVLVETGTSTKDILPLLANIAGMHEEYLKRIYGQYRHGYILIFLNSNGTISSPENARNIANQVTMNVIGAYPSEEGRIELTSYAGELWDEVKIKFKAGKILEVQVMPSEEVMSNRLKERTKDTEAKFGLTEKQRREAFAKMQSMQSQAVEIADKTYPDAFDDRYVTYYNQLYDKYMGAICSEYNITDKEFDEIIREAHQKKWY